MIYTPGIARDIKLSLGTAPIANLYGNVPEEQARETIYAALRAGYSAIDTAPFYGLGLAEQRVGDALRTVPRNTYCLSTKVGRVLVDGKAQFDFTRDGILASLESSLKRLRTERLDIAYLHDPDDYEQQALKEALPTLVELREQGVVGAIGAGMNQWEMLSRFAERGVFDVFLLAGRYTLLEQGAHKFLDFCFEQHIRLILGGVFNSGILATGDVENAKYNYQPAPLPIRKRVQQIEAICRRHHVPLAAAAVQFAASHPAVNSLILGAASPGEAMEGFELSRLLIPDDLWMELETNGFIGN